MGWDKVCRLDKAKKGPRCKLKKRLGKVGQKYNERKCI